MDPIQLEDLFAYHPPSSPAVAEDHQSIRHACAELAAKVNTVCPESREKSLAITHIQEAMMCANAAIAIHQ